MSGAAKKFLLPIGLAIPMYIPPEDIAVSVFSNFLHDEFEQEGVEDDGILEEDIEPNQNILQNLAVTQGNAQSGCRGTTDVIGNQEQAVIVEVGVSIREIANEFAKSKHRKAIRKEADEVDLSAINFDRFFLMLDEVFKHGITKHHLVALFFFCSDVLVRCVKAKLRELGMNLFKWSIQYIVDRVCKWITENGGWEKVIKGTFFIPRKFIYVSAGVIAIAAVCWLSVKGIKK